MKNERKSVQMKRVLHTISFKTPIVTVPQFIKSTAGELVVLLSEAGVRSR